MKIPKGARLRLGAFLGICPRCLYRRRAACIRCRHTGKFWRWMESERVSRSRLSDKLALELHKVRDAYWRDTGKRWSEDDGPA